MFLSWEIEPIAVLSRFWVSLSRKGSERWPLDASVCCGYVQNHECGRQRKKESWRNRRKNVGIAGHHIREEYEKLKHEDTKRERNAWPIS